jgi:hypothetical protein
MLRKHAASRTWQATARLARRHRVAAAVSLIIAGLAAASSVQAVAASRAPAFWNPSAAQAERAIVAAHLYASSTIPSATGAPVTPLMTNAPRSGASLLASAKLASSWPANITSISYIGSYRQTAEQFEDGSPVPDNPPVIVLRMTGRFSVEIPSPNGARPYATGTVLTAVLDANTGQVLDFGLDNSAKPALPDPVVAFRR